jgi:hypothetical protein
MPLCGFNQKMLDGLRQFGEGLYDQAEKRAKEDDCTIRESFDNEIQEMDIFFSILSAKDQIKYQALLGVAHLAQALYRNAQGSEAPKEVFFSELEKAIDSFVRVDEKYYGELRPGNDPTHALKRLGEWME